MSEQDHSSEALEPAESVEPEGSAGAPEAASAAGETASEEEQAAETVGPAHLQVLTDARKKRAARIALIVAAVGVAAVFGFLGYQAFANRLEAARKVDRATALIEKADVIVVQVDTVVRSEVTSGLAEPARSVAVRVPEATKALEEALALLEQARSGNNLDDLRRNDLLNAAAASRLEMMEQAPEILRLNLGAAQALAPAREGWDKLIAADKKSDEAVARYNKLTKSGVRDSSALNKQVATELAAARASFDQAEQLFPEGPFEDYIAYVDVRISLNRLSQQSDAAWLKGDVKGANSVTTTYNTQDVLAVEKAKRLPETPEKAIADAFTAAAQRPTEAYYKARDAATDADEALR